MDREVADDKGLAELWGRRDEIAVMVEDHGGAVEDELVLAADKVDVGERAGRVGGARGEHPLALNEDAGTVRRRIDRHNELRAPLAQPTDGPQGAPGVLANRHADADPSDQKERVPVASRNEVAPLVKDPVVGEQLLAHDRAHLAVGTHGGGVVEIAVLFHEADDSHAVLGRSRYFLQREKVAFDETRLEQEILGRVTGEHELGEHRQARTRGFGLGELGNDLVGVAVEITDGGVQLAQRDAQVAHDRNPTGGPYGERRTANDEH